MKGDGKKGQRKRVEKGHHTHALHGTRLVLQGLGLLCLLLELHLKVLAALQGALQLVAALGALQTQHHLLRGLGLLVEDGLGLTTKTLLLAVVTTLTCESKTCETKGHLHNHTRQVHPK